jgi:hypothetical protein
MDEYWDNLFILDACRFDYFNEIFQDYLQGSLYKKNSVGTTTLEWCENSFTKWYDDIVYISSNPHINSQIPIKGFDAKKHFFKIIDVWNFGWDEKLGTVHPEKMNKNIIQTMEKYPGKRYIFHYLQPHAPYIHDKTVNIGFPQPDLENLSILTGIQNGRNSSSLSKHAREKLLNTISKHGPFKTTGMHWRLRELFLLPPATPMDAIRRKIGVKGLRNAYKLNLELVLKYVKEIIHFLSGKIIISSDHGELLGEDNQYSHTYGSLEPLLLEIPWLIINK